MYEQISSNRRRSRAMLAGFVAIYAAIGASTYLMFGWWGAGVIAAGALATLGVSAWRGSKLPIELAGGERIERAADAPELWRRTENLAITAGIPMPELYVARRDFSANAFAAGRTPQEAKICVTQGLLNTLDDLELEAVLAHEISHIRNEDVRLMTYAAMLAGSLALLAQVVYGYALFLAKSRSMAERLRRPDRRVATTNARLLAPVVVIVAPISALLVKSSISREREHLADASAVELTRYPQALASALQAIDEHPVRSPTRDERVIGHMMIAAPLRTSGRFGRFFASHPPIDERIARLTELAGGVQHQRGSVVAQTPGQSAAPTSPSLDAAT